VDPRQDPDAWSDAFLDAHRSAPGPDAERDRQDASRALQDLPSVTRWMLTRGGRQPDLDTIQRIQRSLRLQATAAKWEAIFTIIGVVLLCLFVFVWLNTF
jgi:hypothetical protein